MLRLEIIQVAGGGTAHCAICLLPCEIDPVMVAVRGGESEVVHLATTPYVCRRCVAGGIDHMVRELRNRAEHERRVADQLKRWADQGIEVALQLEGILGSDRSLAWL